MTDDTAAREPATEAVPARRRVKPTQILTFVVGIALVLLIFLVAIPRFADYHEVWAAMSTLTPIEFWSLAAAMVFNLYTYWLANQAAVPGMSLAQSAVLTQTGTTVANTLPAGGAVAIGVNFAILGSWGFTPTDATLFVGVTGIWNIFVKLGLPVIALGLLVVTGHTYPALVGAAAIGIAVLAVAVLLLVLVFRSKEAARKVGRLLGRALSAIRRPLHRPPVTDMDERAVRFRKETIVLVAQRWVRLTWTTVLSQVALCFVLVLALRHMSVAEQQISAVEIFAVYAFSRLLSAIPITPGGVGVIDLGYVLALTALDKPESAQIIAAVLLFRVLTYGVQIPLGIVTYVIWRRHTAWFRDTPPPGAVSAQLAARTQPAASANV